MENKVLEKIDKLRIEHGWSIYMLSYESGITQSTIANMFSRKTMPSIATLKSICEAFGMTLSEFFNENALDLTIKNQVLISKYNQLCDRDKFLVDTMIDALITSKENE